MTRNEKTIIIGIGGMGGNFINAIATKLPSSATCLAINTNAPALELSVAPNKVLIGTAHPNGTATGGNTALGRQAAERSITNIVPYLTDSDTVVLVAGLGGGTGGGALPVIARHALKLDKQVICVVSTPFTFEGKARADKTQESLEALNSMGIRPRIFENQSLFAAATDKMTFADAFQLATDTIIQWISDPQFA